MRFSLQHSSTAEEGQRGRGNEQRLPVEAALVRPFSCLGRANVPVFRAAANRISHVVTSTPARGCTGFLPGRLPATSLWLEQVVDAEHHLDTIELRLGVAAGTQTANRTTTLVRIGAVRSVLHTRLANAAQTVSAAGVARLCLMVCHATSNNGARDTLGVQSLSNTAAYVLTTTLELTADTVTLSVTPLALADPGRTTDMVRAGVAANIAADIFSRGTTHPARRALAHRTALIATRIESFAAGETG